MSSKLTHKERILRILRREEVDHLPTHLELTQPLSRKLADDLGVAPGDLLGTFDNHIVYAYLNDTVKIQDGIVYDNWGVGYDEFEGAAIRVHPMADKDEVEEYVFPDPKDPTLLSTIEETVKDYAGEYLVPAYQRWLLFERACWLRGVENFMVDMAIDRAFAEWLLDKITDYQVELAKRCIEAGVNCGRTGDDWGSQKSLMVSPQMWREMIKPRLKRVWDVYKNAGLPIIHHSCGDIMEIIPDLIELGLDILHPIQRVLPKDVLKRQYGSALTFYGGIDTQQVVPFGSPEEIRAEVRSCVEQLGTNGGYIIGLGHTLTSETPLVNVRALLEATKEFRRPEFWRV